MKRDNVQNNASAADESKWDLSPRGRDERPRTPGIAQGRQNFCRSSVCIMQHTKPKFAVTAILYSALQFIEAQADSYPS